MSVRLPSGMSDSRESDRSLFEALGLLPAGTEPDGGTAHARDDDAAAACLPPVPPPEALRKQILAAIREDGNLTVRSDTLPASEPFPGVRMKRLATDRARGAVFVLVEMDPGAEIPSHHHGGTEFSFIIRGSCEIGPLELRAGDLHRAAAESDHPKITTAGGCTALLVMARGDAPSL